MSPPKETNAIRLMIIMYSDLRCLAHPKVTSDIHKNMKLSFLGTYGELSATSLSRSGGTAIFETPTEIAQQIDKAGFTVPWRIYTDIYYAPTQRYSHTFALKFQHILRNLFFIN